MPLGNTVSRCALITTFGRGLAPGRSPMTLPSASIADVLEPNLAQHLGVHLSALRFLEGWRFDFADADLIGDGLHFVRAREIDSGANCGDLQEGWSKIGGALLCDPPLSRQIESRLAGTNPSDACNGQV